MPAGWSRWGTARVLAQQMTGAWCAWQHGSRAQHVQKQGRHPVCATPVWWAAASSQLPACCTQFSLHLTLQLGLAPCPGGAHGVPVRVDDGVKACARLGQVLVAVHGAAVEGAQQLLDAQLGVQRVQEHLHAVVQQAQGKHDAGHHLRSAHDQASRQGERCSAVRAS